MRSGRVVLAALAAALVLPVGAGANAALAPGPTAGSPGLPDGRVYEEASPANKDGNSAGAPIDVAAPQMLAEPGGDGVAYSQIGGAIGAAPSGFQFYTVAKRSATGWADYGAFPQTIGESAKLNLEPHETGFSADLTQDFFWANDTFLPEAPTDAGLLYDIPSATTTWLDPPPATGEGESRHLRMAGFSADMSTFYFRTTTGFYESHDGVLSVAGVLPDGSIEPGAEAAGLPVEAVYTSSYEPVFQGGELHNQVSEDGDDAFFVSAGANPQLYLRETAPDGSQRTVLVSQDALLPDVGGLPAPAPHGVVPIAFPQEGAEGEALSSPPNPGHPFESPGYVYAAPDGARAFFASTDALTSAAVQAEEHGLPAGDAKEYMFDTATGTLTYLPGVADAPLVEFNAVESPFNGQLVASSPILASAQDGSRFLFNGPGGLSLWSDVDTEGGTVTLIAPHPVDGEARATPDGSVFAFESAAEFAGFNNGGEHFSLENGSEGPFRNQQVYRYDVAGSALSCVSCPPRGVSPTGNAYMSHDVGNGAQNGGSLLFANRGISADGSRVFFDSPDPLVPQDTNTAPPTPLPNSQELVEHGRDVYEWENGRLFLISTGTSAEDSYVGDESANGNDVFFSTAQGLAPGDTDEAYDVYDARVPRPGDNPPATPAPCEGDVCQGPPSVPSLITPSGSATFNGLGNGVGGGGGGPALAKPKPKSKAKGCKKGFVKKKNKCARKKAEKKGKK